MWNDELQEAKDLLESEKTAMAGVKAGYEQNERERVCRALALKFHEALLTTVHRKKLKPKRQRSRRHIHSIELSPRRLVCPDTSPPTCLVF